jgi:putative transposase
MKTSNATVSRIMTFTRRHLPHWHPSATAVFITWRLHWSLPTNIPPLQLKGDTSSGKEFICRDRVLDRAQTGPVWLTDQRVAACVQSRLQKLHHQKFFALQAYVLMANHVHALIEPKIPLAQITQHMKGSTAREANQILNRSGSAFWQDESFDHWIRTPGEWQKIKTYIEANPVNASLCSTPQAWPWSSASHEIQPQ